LLQRVFRLRTCEDSVFQNRSRPCLLYQIRRCTAPCVGHITAAAYAEDVKSAQLYLEGRSDTALKRLEARMQQASDARRYEEAAIYRDQIQSLAKVSQRQYADTGAHVDRDSIAVALERGRAWGDLLRARGGSQRGTQETRLAALREALGLPDTVQRIECFDVSHTMGEATVAACVVYDRMDMCRGEYRRYNIEGARPGDDYGALA